MGYPTSVQQVYTNVNSLNQRTYCNSRVPCIKLNYENKKKVEMHQKSKEDNQSFPLHLQEQRPHAQQDEKRKSYPQQNEVCKISQQNNVRNPSVSLSPTLTRNEKVKHYIRIKTHKPIALRFWVESGVSVLCVQTQISLVLFFPVKPPL